MRPERLPIEISRREVLNNLVRFKDALIERKHEGSQSEPDRSYPVMFNSRTGDLRFAQRMANLEHRFAPEQKNKGALEDWRKAQLHVWERGKKHWEVELCDESNHEIASQGLAPLAWRIIDETLHVLNQMIEEHTASLTHAKGLLPEEAALQDLSEIRLSTNHEEIEDLPGWQGVLDRLKAEELLQKAPVGTYLLRHGDPATKAIAFHLSEENHLKVKAYLCTVIEPEGKISDILLIHQAKGWALYQDNPDLFDLQYAYYPSIQTLLAKIKDRALRPL